MKDKKRKEIIKRLDQLSDENFNRAYLHTMNLPLAGEVNQRDGVENLKNRSVKDRVNNDLNIGGR